MTAPRRARRWTLARRLTDRYFNRVFPGQHHAIWGQP